MKRILLAATVLVPVTVAAIAAPAFGQGQPQAPVRSILEVAPDLYRYENTGYYGLYLVTDEGIIMTDPINRDAATWLAGELETRHPDLDVEYILYSHHHADHASGAAIWPEATVISHEASVAPLTPPAEDAPLAGQSAAADANGDGKLQQSEANPNLAGRFAELDVNGDGGLTAREIFPTQFGELSIYGGVRVPDQTYSGEGHTVELGGKTVEMIHVDALHAPDLSYIFFPAERTLFVVDVINIKRMPIISATGFSEADLDGVTEAALALDFDVVVPGHGDVGNRDDVEAHRQYHRDVLAGVRAGIEAGQTLEQIQASLPLDEYSSWSAFERNAQNIAGAYGYVTANAD